MYIIYFKVLIMSIAQLMQPVISLINGPQRMSLSSSKSSSILHLRFHVCFNHASLICLTYQLFFASFPRFATVIKLHAFFITLIDRKRRCKNGKIEKKKKRKQCKNIKLISFCRRRLRQLFVVAGYKDMARVQQPQP